MSQSHIKVVIVPGRLRYETSCKDETSRKAKGRETKSVKVCTVYSGHAESPGHFSCIALCEQILLDGIPTSSNEDGGEHLYFHCSGVPARFKVTNGR